MQFFCKVSTPFFPSILTRLSKHRRRALTTYFMGLNLGTYRSSLIIITHHYYLLHGPELGHIHIQVTSQLLDRLFLRVAHCVRRTNQCTALFRIRGRTAQHSTAHPSIHSGRKYIIASLSCTDTQWRLPGMDPPEASGGWQKTAEGTLS